MADLSMLRRVGMVLSVSGATFLAVFQSNAMTVALPTIQKSLNISEANLQYPISVYNLTNGCFLLVSGRLADIVGHRLLFLIGTMWFAVWSLIAAFAPNETSLIIFMALLGLGPALNMPAGIAILASNFNGKAKDQAFGVLGAGQPLGGIAGLVLSGLLCQSSASWRTVFYIQSGLAFLSVLLGIVFLPKNETSYDAGVLKRLRRIDWLGAVLVTSAFVLMSFSLANSQSSPKGWRTPYIPVLLCMSILELGTFVAWEMRRERLGQSAILPLSIFKAPHLGRILLVVFSGWWSFNVLIYYAALYFQSVLLLDPLQTSLRFVPMALAGITVSLLGGFLVGRVRPVLLIMIGLLCCAAATTIFALINIHASYWSMAFLIMILAPGLDVTYIVGNIQIAAAVDKSHQALAGGIFNVATRVGTSIGLAVTSSIASTVSSHYLLTLQPKVQSQMMPRPRLGANSNYTSLLLTPSSPSVLLSGYKAAAWVCFATAGVAMACALLGLRGLKVLEPDSDPKARDGTENPIELETNSATHPTQHSDLSLDRSERECI